MGLSAERRRDINDLTRIIPFRFDAVATRHYFIDFVIVLLGKLVGLSGSGVEVFATIRYQAVRILRLCIGTKFHLGPLTGNERAGDPQIRTILNLIYRLSL